MNTGRREFFRALGLVRSRNGGRGSAETRDAAVEYGGELLSLAAIMALAITGSQDRLVHYSVVTNNSLGEERNFSELDSHSRVLHEHVGKILPTLENIYEKWRAAYRKSRQESYTDTVTECDSDGNCKTKTVTKYRTVYYWDEPRQITSQGLDHSVLSGWINYFHQFQGRLVGVINESPGAINFESGANAVVYKEELQDIGTQKWLATMVYGLVGTGFVFYEEADELIARLRNDYPILKGGDFRKRRTALKLISSLIGSLTIGKVQAWFSENNKGLKDQIVQNHARVIREMDADSTSSFVRLLGVNPASLTSTFNTMLSLSKMCADENVNFDWNWPELKNLFADLGNLSQKAGGNLSEFFRIKNGLHTVPDGMVSVLRSVWGSREIRNFASNKKVELDIRHLSDAVLLTFILATLMAGGEFVLYPTIDRVIDENS